MSWVRDIDSFYNFIGYVINRAPNSFPIEDYLPDDEQLNLDRAFNELRYGVSLIETGVADAKKRQKLLSLLDEALAAYRGGADIKGAHLLHDFESQIFKS